MLVSTWARCVYSTLMLSWSISQIVKLITSIKEKVIHYKSKPEEKRVMSVPRVTPVPRCTLFTPLQFQCLNQVYWSEHCWIYILQMLWTTVVIDPNHHSCSCNSSLRIKHWWKTSFFTPTGVRARVCPVILLLLETPDRSEQLCGALKRWRARGAFPLLGEALKYFYLRA